jgi:hypothetical protein
VFSIVQEMLDVITKGVLVCYTSVIVIFNGALKFAGAVYIRVFVNYSFCKSRGGGYGVTNASTLKLSGRQSSYRVCIC